MSYKRWVFTAIILFSIGLILGLSAPAGLSDIISEDITALEDLGGFLISLPPAIAAVLIFVNNAITVVLSFAFSPILCLAPILTLVANGWLLSFVGTVVLQEQSLGFLIAGILPHGILELPALIIAQAAALEFGIATMLSLINREKRNLLLPVLKQDLRYLTISLILLLPAAFIEIFITPLFLT